MADDDLVDPWDDVSNEDSNKVDDIEEMTAPPKDNLDVEIVDEFDVDDFDEEFDDDFEEEIQGEYELADDQYGAEFDKEFGHLTDPTRKPPRKAPEAGKKEDE